MAEIAQFDERPEPSRPIRRFPRLLEVVIAELDAMILTALARRAEVTLEIGRGLNEEKKVLGHGKFQLHFEETFASLFSLRTAERYMKKAKEADAAPKIDSVSNFKLASDEGARAIHEAGEEDRAEVESVAKQAIEKRDSKLAYRLPLRMTASEIESIETLRKLPDWRKAERKIVRLLRKLFVEYCVTSADGRSH